MKKKIASVLFVFGMIFSAFATTVELEDVYRGYNFSIPLAEDQYQAMPGTCRILLIRHGETEWNVLGLGQGWTDIPLNEEGRRQAEQLSACLEKMGISAVYSSPLSRAAETAHKIAERQLKCDIYFDPALRFYEKNDEIASLSKAERKEAVAKEIQTQAKSYLTELAAYHSGQNVVIITHGKVIKNIYKMLNPEEKRKIKIGNACMVSLLGTSTGLSIEQSFPVNVNY